MNLYFISSVSGVYLVLLFINSAHRAGNFLTLEGVVAPWCNPLTLQPEQSGGVGSSPGRAPSLERHDKGLRTRLGLLYFCDPSAWR